MDVTLSLDNDSLRDLVAQGLQKRMKERERDLRPAWDGVLEQVYLSEKNLFANEGRTAEEPKWAKLSNKPISFHGPAAQDRLTKKTTKLFGYRDWKAINFPGKKILHLTGKLERMLTTESGGAHVARRTRRLVFGTNYTNYAGVPGRPRSKRDRLTGDLGGITAEGRRDYYPMEARTPIRLDAASAAAIGMPLVDHLLDASD